MISGIVNQKVYSFIPNDDKWINSININNINIADERNDIYESYNATIQIDGKLIICNDKSKLKSFCKKVIRETYQEYLDFISNYDITKDKWIYNIIDGLEEQNNIIYQDDKIIIIPDYKWNYNYNCNETTKLHILTIPKDKKLRSIRSLGSEHIELLNHCQNKTSEIIKIVYKIDSDFLKMYFHYAPSTWHLHIHFAHVENLEINSSVEYCHDLPTVIYNLGLSNDYYKNILNRRV